MQCLRSKSLKFCSQITFSRWISEEFKVMCVRMLMKRNTSILRNRKYYSNCIVCNNWNKGATLNCPQSQYRYLINDVLSFFQGSFPHLNFNPHIAPWCLALNLNKWFRRHHKLHWWTDLPVVGHWEPGTRHPFTFSQWPPLQPYAAKTLPPTPIIILVAT